MGGKGKGGGRSCSKVLGGIDAPDGQRQMCIRDRSYTQR